MFEKNQNASSLKTLSGQTCSKENLNASRLSKHPPVKGGGDVKTFRWDHRLQRDKQKFSIHGIYLGSPLVVTLGQQYDADNFNMPTSYQ